MRAAPGPLAGQRRLGSGTSTSGLGKGGSRQSHDGRDECSRPAAVFEDVGAAPLASCQIAADRQHVQFGHARVVSALDVDAVDRPVTRGGQDRPVVQAHRSALIRVGRPEPVVDLYRGGSVEVHHAEVAVTGQVEALPGEPDGTPDARPEVDGVPFFLAQPGAESRESDRQAFSQAAPL